MEQLNRLIKDVLVQLCRLQISLSVIISKLPFLSIPAAFPGVLMRAYPNMC